MIQISDGKTMKRLIVYSSVSYAFALFWGFFLGKLVLDRVHSLYAAVFVGWLLLSLSACYGATAALRVTKRLFWRTLAGCISVSLVLTWAEESARLSQSELAFWAMLFFAMSLIAVVGALSLNSLRRNWRSLARGTLYAAILPPVPLYLIEKYGPISLYHGAWEWAMYCLTAGLLIGSVMGISITLGFLTDRAPVTPERQVAGAETARRRP